MSHETTVPVERSGHPPGLYLLFFTEMWERFCYYGMRALLALYVAQQFASGQGGASLKYGAFTALVYATGIFGGMVADRLLGYRRSIVLGGLFIAAGEFMLLVPRETEFLLGLALMIVGNGLFKPNISTIVGKLYEQGDPRRDRGFTIFYMGINLGALLAPILCGLVAFQQEDGTRAYRYGFALAGLGMLAGLVNFHVGRKSLGAHGLPPAGREGFGPIGAVTLGGFGVAGIAYLLLAQTEKLVYVLYGLMAVSVAYLLYIGAKDSKVQRERLWILILLLFANTLFWALFEQAGNSFNFLAENLTDRATPLGEFKTEWYQSVNPMLIVALAPLFVLLWKNLGKRDPSIPAKFGLALIQLGLGFSVLIFGIQHAPASGKLPFFCLMLTYLLHTMGELCLSPVGLSMVTKLAPVTMVGFVMGAWFMSISVGNFLGGQISAAVGKQGDGAKAIELADYGSVFSPVMWVAIAAGVVLVLASPLLNKWMHGVK